MPVTDSQIAALPNASPSSKTPPKRKGARTVAPASPIVSEAAANADFRKKYGIPPKGAGPHPPSSYGFPLPPADHPESKKYARAVLSRAHQSENFDPAEVAKQVAKARRILGESPSATKEARASSLGIFALREVSSDASGVARVIIIREGPGNLGDRHWYPAETLADSVKSGLWEGAQCYFDHPTQSEDRDIPERSVKNLAGWFSDTKLVDYTDPERGTCKAIEAQFHPQAGEDRTIGLLRTCVEYAKAFPTKAYVGLSINACGDGAPAEIDGEEWNRVDRITEVVSVDLVTRAGAGGKPIAFRESFKVAMTLKKVDPAKIKEAAAADGKAATRKFLEDAAIQLTPEQDQALDAALGIVNGGKLDQVIDAAAGVSPADDEDDVEESGAPMETEEEKKAREAREAKGEDEDEITEADKEPFKGMSPDELLTHAAKLHKKINKIGAPDPKDDDEVEEGRKTEPVGRSTKEADEEKDEEKREKRESAKLRHDLKERVVKDVLAAQNVPENYRPLLSRELMERETLVKESDIATFASDWAKAHIAPVQAATSIRENGGGSATNKIAITFKPQSSYDE